jgi:hypothetical protein
MSMFGLMAVGRISNIPPPRSIFIASAVNNVNLRTLHDAAFPAPPLTSAHVVNFTVNAGVIVGSGGTGSAAMDVGSWPENPTVNLIILGRVQGAGGNGGGTAGITGLGGGIALFTRKAINLVVTGGQLWGGGGGGGGATNTGTFWNGGGGAGTVPGAQGGFFNGGFSFNTQGQPGTPTAGGAGLNGPGGNAGAGGGPGVAGGASSYSSFSNGGGGAAGAAIDGAGFRTFGTWNTSTLTFTPGGTGADGDVRGPQV